MVNVIAKKIDEHTTEQQQRKTNITMCILIAVVLVGSLFFEYLIYFAFLLSLLNILFSTNKQIFAFLLFLFPFALIFKTSMGSSSLFTYLELFAIFILLLKQKKVKSGIFMSIALLIAVCLLSFSNILEIVKLLIIVLLYYLFTENYKSEDSRLYLHFFVLGLLLSTFLGLFKESIPRFLSLYTDLNYEWIGGVRTLRFSGIFNDPNYFAIALMQALTISILFLFQKGTKKSLFFTSGILIICGLFTISKSFYLLLIGVLCIILLYNAKKSLLPVLLAVFAIALFVMWNPGGILNQILYRFNSYDLDTDRIGIWSNYISVIKSSPKNMLIGAGLGAAYVGKAAHSIYIEAIYYIGAIGLIMYAISLTYITGCQKIQIRRNLLNYLGFICLITQYAFLCGTTSYEFTFYLMISYMIYNQDWSSNQENKLRGK